MCMELRWDSGTEVVIRAAAKHGVNSLPDGSLNKRGNRRSRAETKGPVGGGGGAFIPRALAVRGQREGDKWHPAEQMLPVSNDGVPASRSSRTRDGQRLWCPVRKGGQRATAAARVPPVWTIVKARRTVAGSVCTRCSAPFCDLCLLDLDYDYG